MIAGSLDLLHEEGAIRESDYPYVSGAQDKNKTACTSKSKAKIFNLSKEAWTNVQKRERYGDKSRPYSKEDFLEELRKSPFAIAIKLGSRDKTFMFYDGTTTYNTACKGSGGHAMNAVGYGWDSEINDWYAIIRNSWGSYWGDKGYMKFALGDVNQKGLCEILSYSILALP